MPVPARSAGAKSGEKTGRSSVIVRQRQSSRMHERTHMNKLSLTAIALLSMLGTAPAFAQDIPVAVAGPMTGGQATFGRQFRDGAEQAVADINASGGVLGKKLRARSRRRRLRSETSGARWRRNSPAWGVVVPRSGHYCSSSSIPASDAYLEGGVLQITPGSTNPQFTDRGMVEHVPHLRARRPAGRLRRRLSGEEISRTRTSPSSTTRPPTAKASPTR